jgi:hypothetical protein
MGDLLQVHVQREHDLATGYRSLHQHGLPGNRIPTAVPSLNLLAGTTVQCLVERLFYAAGSLSVPDIPQHGPGQVAVGVVSRQIPLQIDAPHAAQQLLDGGGMMPSQDHPPLLRAGDPTCFPLAEPQGLRKEGGGLVRIPELGGRHGYAKPLLAHRHRHPVTVQDRAPCGRHLDRLAMLVQGDAPPLGSLHYLQGGRPGQDHARAQQPTSQQHPAAQSRPAL